MGVQMGGNRRQRGAAAIEFALVFLLFFTVFYAIVSYTFPMLLVQQMNMAVAEGARVGLRVDPSRTDFGQYDTYPDAVIGHSKQATNDLLSESVLTALAPGDFDVEVTLTGDVLSVRVAYDYQAAPFVVPLVFPGIGAVPQLPETLEASTRIEF
ncbi:TadE/TadG family type IV pilus assembly protein [Alkalilimnicola ehrlichii MLHE-1]|nr:TadE/TadG family type IV pilus assembly protein [Alkalilimnicola ehrlichii]